MQLLLQPQRKEELYHIPDASDPPLSESGVGSAPVSGLASPDIATDRPVSSLGSNFSEEHPTHNLGNITPPSRRVREEAILDGFCPGDKIGDFQLLRSLGRGTFSRVFLARETSAGNRPVVLKITTRGASEAKILGKFDHPGIMPVYSSHPDQNTRLTVTCTPFWGTSTLQNLIEDAFGNPKNGEPPSTAEIILRTATSRSLPTDPVIKRPSGGCVDPRMSYIDGVIWLAVQICQALEQVHQEGVAHQDLKPSNILLNREGNPVLLDFNLAATQDDQLPAIGGTISYAAPERLRQMIEASPSNDSGVRADLYSLGVILYELLTGERPYGAVIKGGEPSELALAMLRTQELGFRPIQEANPAVSHHLAQTIERCLASNPGHRPANAGALRMELERCYSPRFRPIHGRRRSLWVFGLVAAGVLLVLSGILAFHWGASSAIAPTAAAAAEPAQSASSIFIPAVPKDGLALFQRGLAKMQQDDYPGAIQEWEKSQRLGKSDFEIAGYLAYAYSRIGRMQQAIEFSTTSINLATIEKKEYAALYNNRGHAYLQTSQSEKAIADFDKAIQLDPLHPTPRANRLLTIISQHIRQKNRVSTKTLQESLHLARDFPQIAEGCYFVAVIHALALTNGVHMGEQVKQDDLVAICKEYCCKSAKLGMSIVEMDWFPVVGPYLKEVLPECRKLEKLAVPKVKRFSRRIVPQPNFLVSTPDTPEIVTIHSPRRAE